MNSTIVSLFFLCMFMIIDLRLICELLSNNKLKCTHSHHPLYLSLHRNEQVVVKTILMDIKPLNVSSIKMCIFFVFCSFVACVRALQYFAENVPEFIRLHFWLQVVLTYRICTVLKQWLYRRKTDNIKELKDRIKQCWEEIDQEVIDARDARDAIARKSEEDVRGRGMTFWTSLKIVTYQISNTYYKSLLNLFSMLRQ